MIVLCFLVLERLRSWLTLRSFSMEQTVRSRALGFQRFSETRLGSPRDCQEMRFVIVGRQALVK